MMLDGEDKSLLGLASPGNRPLFQSPWNPTLGTTPWKCMWLRSWICWDCLDSGVGCQGLYLAQDKSLA